MLFGQNGNLEEALKNSIQASIDERVAKACDTWDPASVLAPAWGVKEMVDPNQAGEIRDYLKSMEGSKLTLSSGTAVTVLKGDVKEKNDEAILIFRYQIV